MYELKYKITEADVKSVNKSIMWMYFIPYLVASLIGIGVGIAATILRPRTEMLVLGIVLIVLGAILLVCAMLLLIAPKNFVVSALLPDDETERNVKFSDDNITVSTDGKDDIVIDYFEITKLKQKKTYMLAYIGKEQVLLIKNDAARAVALDELFAFIKTRLAKVLPDTVGEQIKPAESENERNAELTDTLVGANDDMEKGGASDEKSDVETDGSARDEQGEKGE